ncbi:MAG: glycerophosphodiester phosphodiesterase family protein [Pseudomonadota bacterium]
MPSWPSVADPFPFQGAFAHRGFHGPERPENSLAAVAAARTANIGCEIDVRLAGDNTPVVFHDQDLKRLCHRGERIDRVASPHSATVRIERSRATIPTLAAALAVAGRTMPLLLELKTDGLPRRRLQAFAQAVSQLLRGHVGPIACLSFDRAFLQSLRQRGCPCPLGLALGHKAIPKDTGSYGTGGYEFVAVDRRLDPIPDLQPQLAWTVRDPSEARALLRSEIGVIFEGFNPLFLRTTAG